MSGEDDGRDQPDRPAGPEIYAPGMGLGLSGEETIIDRAFAALLRPREVRWRQRVIWSAIGVVLIVIVYTFAYQWMLLTFEGVEVSITDAFQVVVEAFTTAGFGGDTGHWNTHPMNLFVVLMNLTGVLLVFIALPVFVFPMLQETLSPEPPTSTDLEDHIVLCSHTQRLDALQAEFDAAGVPSVVVDRDPEEVLELTEAGANAIVGPPETERTLRAANLGAARALVTDVSERRNLAVILAAREVNEDVTIVSIAENQSVAQYHADAGADRVIRPSQTLGRSLAKKAGPGVTNALADAIEIDVDIELTELLVTEDSEVVGQTLAEANLTNRLGAPVIGAWAKGGFLAAPDPSTRLEPFTILLVAGRHSSFDGVIAHAVSPHPPDEARVVVAGQDSIAQSVTEYLDEVEIPYTVIAEENRDGVAVTGDVTHEETLAAADVGTATAVVLSLDDDTQTMYAAVALKRHAPDAEILARASETEQVSQIYRAGAHYVLTLSVVTARLLGRSLIDEDGDDLAPEFQFATRRVQAPKFDELSLQGLNIRSRTGALVFAVEREGELLTRLPPSFTLQEEDTLILVGDEESLDEFEELVS